MLEIWVLTTEQVFSSWLIVEKKSIGVTGNSWPGAVTAELTVTVFFL